MSDNTRYLERFQRVIDYIYQNPNDPLDLDQLADIAHLSPCHWHRIYTAICGETLATTVKRVRLHWGAAELVNSDAPIADIAQRSGYSSLQTFNRAFSAAYGMPPARYRREGDHKRFELRLPATGESTMEKNSMDVRFECFAEPLQLVGITHTGCYTNIGVAFEKLYGWMAAGKIWPDLKSVMGVYLDDPSAVPEAELRSMACALLRDGSTVQPGEGMERMEIEASRFAVLRYKGPYAGIPKAYEWFFGTWLAQSGEEMDERACFEDYLNNPREVSPEELLTDIYMPLKTR